MTKFANLKKGEILSETQYYKVEKTSGNEVELVNDSGEHIVVDNLYVEGCLISGNQYIKEEKITRTDAAALFLASANVALTVNFNTKVKPENVVEEIMKKVNGALLGEIEKAVKAGVKKAIDGEERTIAGRHFGTANEFGRVQFIDMEENRDSTKSYDTRLRQVDPRTINWMVIKNVKYIVK